MKTLVALPVLFAGLLPLGPQPLAVCPTDTLAVCDVFATSSAPSYAAFGCAFNSSGASYDLVAGRLSVNANGFNSDVALTTEDLYMITGPAMVDPVAFSANLAVRAKLLYYGNVSAEIRSGGDAQTAAFGPCYCGGVGFVYSLTLSLPLAHAVGEPFRLTMRLHGSSPSTRLVSQAQGTGMLAFELPPGFSVTSCQGYSSAPTPSRPMAWGRLKAIYR